MRRYSEILIILVNKGNFKKIIQKYKKLRKTLDIIISICYDESIINVTNL